MPLKEFALVCESFLQVFVYRGYLIQVETLKTYPTCYRLYMLMYLNYKFRDCFAVY